MKPPEASSDPLLRCSIALDSSRAPRVSVLIQSVHVGVARLCLEKARREAERLELLVVEREEEIAAMKRVEQAEVAIDEGATKATKATEAA